MIDLKPDGFLFSFEGISSDHKSPKKSHLQVRQLNETSHYRDSPHRSVRGLSGRHSESLTQSKRDNSGEEQEDLPADNDSTQNNPSSNSDVVSEEGTPVDENFVLGRNRSMEEEEEGVGRGGLVGVREYREMSPRAKGTEIQRGERSVSSRNNHSLSSVRNRRDESHTRNSLYSGAEEDNEMVPSYSTSPGEGGDLSRAKKQPTPHKQSTPHKQPTPHKQSNSHEEDIIHSPEKKVRQSKQQSDIPNQSVVQVCVMVQVPNARVKKIV